MAAGRRHHTGRVKSARGDWGRRKDRGLARGALGLASVGRRAIYTWIWGASEVRLWSFCVCVVV